MEKSQRRDAVTVRLTDARRAGKAGAGARGEPDGPVRDPSGIYREVQGSAVFREVRRRYRRFAFPATAAFLAWYLAYVLAAIAAPEVMARPVTGALNVAILTGLAQFVSTFLLTWAYARHARLRRDPAAQELRWAVTVETLRAGGLGQQRPALTSGRPPEGQAPGIVLPGQRRRGDRW